MTTNESLDGIQARIEDLQNTIAEKEEQIRQRARHLKDELQAELSPLEVVRKHPLETAGAVLAAGVLIGRALKPSCKSSRPARAIHAEPAGPSRSGITTAMGLVGVDILRSAKDLGFTYLQRYLDRKIR
ncbi:MAG: hypothetical protein FJZ79_01780 [Chlorobi bacterium]|nr:hypothetical protein [Chlorobiota bacterium]